MRIAQKLEPLHMEKPRLKRVAAYCRVSSTKNAQQESLAAQVEYYTRYINRRAGWVLAGVYADQKSGANISGRLEFQRMMQDCRDGKIDEIITKSISRLGRNTVDVMDAIQQLKSLGVPVYFETEELSSENSDHIFFLTALEGLAQAESESRSENVRIGLRSSLQEGTSKLYNRPCYGYRKQADGSLAIYDDEAKIIRQIFDWYLAGHSVVSIIKELAQRGIPSPSGRDTWSKRTLENALQNEKYTGSVCVGKTYGSDFPSRKRHANHGERQQFVCQEHHEPIISAEQFAAVQAERTRRCNVEIVDGQRVRKPMKHSSKCVAEDD